MSRIRLLILVLAAIAVVGGVLAWQQRQENNELARRYDCPDDEIPPVVMPLEDTAGVAVTLTEVARTEAPVALAIRPDDPSLWVAERPGQVLRVVPPATRGEVVLDISAEVSTEGEQGLLGMTFSPDGEHLYLDYTDSLGDTRVVEYAVRSDGLDVESRRDLLVVDQPHRWHNAGHIAFGPDGMLYVALGDGGGQADPDGNGQDPTTLLAALLRIDPAPGGDRQYSIPADNPFAGGDDGAPEVWAYGLRNPWRFSFDRRTGDLWIGDVGDGCYEEIDVIRPDQGGANLGWDLVEGPWVVDPPAPEDAVEPVFSYRRAIPSCAVVGGYVYRGAAIPELAGRYLFSDFCAGWLAALPPDGEGRPETLDVDSSAVVSLAEDPAGELYVLSLNGPIYRLDPAG